FYAVRPQPYERAAHAAKTNVGDISIKIDIATGKRFLGSLISCQQGCCPCKEKRVPLEIRNFKGSCIQLFLILQASLYAAHDQTIRLTLGWVLRVVRWVDAWSNACCALPRLLPTLANGFWKKSNDFCAFASSSRLFSKRIATSYHLCTSAIVCKVIRSVFGETGNTCCALSQSASS